jgi:hypothetical protein
MAATGGGSLGGWSQLTCWSSVAQRYDNCGPELLDRESRADRRGASPRCLSNDIADRECRFSGSDDSPASQRISPRARCVQAATNVGGEWSGEHCF